MSLPVTPGSGATVAADQIGSASPPASSQYVQYIKPDVGAPGASSPVTATNPMPSQGGGGQTGTVPTGAGNTEIKTSAGRLCKVVVTAAGTGTGNVLIYDNASTNSGTVLAAIPATIAAGQIYPLDMPAANGITAANVANGPALTVSYY